MSINAVAPLAGAWIEIRFLIRVPLLHESLPSRERGLKYVYPDYRGKLE